MVDQVFLDQTLTVDGKTVEVELPDGANEYTVATEGSYGGGTLALRWTPNRSQPPDRGPADLMGLSPIQLFDTGQGLIATAPGNIMFKMGTGVFDTELVGSTTPSLQVVLIKHDK